MTERWHLPESLRRRSVEAAREFRRGPTPREAIPWNALRGRQLNGVKFRRQQPIGRFVVDFFAREHRLIIEVDGGVHDAPDQSLRDRERQELLEDLGLGMLRVAAKDVENDLNSVLGVIEQLLELV